MLALKKLNTVICIKIGIKDSKLIKNCLLSFRIVSDSDSEEREDLAKSQTHLTVAIYPVHQGPTYLILQDKKERDNWLYHLTVVSGAGPNAGTQYEQLVNKIMETDGDPTCVIWRHPILLHTKEQITSPLSSLHSETLQHEAVKLFKVRIRIKIILKNCSVSISRSIESNSVDKVINRNDFLCRVVNCSCQWQ